MSPVTPCPICGQPSFVKHCDSKTCRWHRCRLKGCGAVIDLVKRVGYRSGGMAGWLPINLNDGGPR